MQSLPGIALALLISAAAGAQTADDLHLNQIQVIGTHNSYHSGMAPSEFKLLETRNPNAARALEYRHPPLAAQLAGGVRQLELDVYFDPDGGRYAHPENLGMVVAAGLPADPPYDPAHDMLKPGFKVMHIQDLDQRSSCALFTQCLQQVRDWSKAHPRHVPLFLLIETKQGRVPQLPGSKEALPFTPAVFDALEAEILSVFKREELILPDEVRSHHATLPEAIAHGGWPTLAHSRGKVIFLLDQRSNEPVYTEGHPALERRLAFTNATPGAPDAAFTEQNDGTAAQIDSLVEQGYLVRTRTDSDTAQARSNDTARRNQALASGAQILSTDYPAAEPASWTGFSVSLPGGVSARCNPITGGTKVCVAGSLE